MIYLSYIKANQIFQCVEALEGWNANLGPIETTKALVDAGTRERLIEATGLMDQIKREFQSER